jgi:NAD(P)-dependent dehydrogenase (short-subunit alcohol dehydrogenase family)
MGSLVGYIGQEGATIYCATKGAISAFTKALAIEETRYDVRVNAVLPGNILSDNRKRASAQRPDGAEFDRWIDSHQPTGRSGTCEEVGQLCLFLASEAASYLTGVEIIISGGSELGYGVKYPLKLI